MILRSWRQGRRPIGAAAPGRLRFAEPSDAGAKMQRTVVSMIYEDRENLHPLVAGILAERTEDSAL